MEKTMTFYIHIQSDTLAHYLVRGIFCPSQFLTNKNADIQDKYDSFLILSDKKWNAESDCSIEIVLLEEEIAKLYNLQENYVAFAGCLPLSRLKMIHFSDKKKAENVIWNINQGAAYVPDWAISFENKSNQESVSLTAKHSFPDNRHESHLKTNLQRYDRLMGGFAFMSTAYLLEEYQQLDLTTKNLSAISYFNTEIAESVKNQNIKLDNSIINVFSGSDPIYSYLGKEITDKTIASISKKEKQTVIKRFNTIMLDQLDPSSLTFELAMLFTYGKGKVKSDSDLVSGLFNNINAKYVQKLALIFGINTGYTSLRNAYSNTNYTKNIKFKLLTKLEFYLIESLYRYAFRVDMSNNSFSFINNSKLEKNRTIENDNFKYLRLFDTLYAYEKNETKKENDAKKSLLSMIKQTVKEWCSTNAVELDENGFDATLIDKILPLIKENIASKKENHSTKSNKEFESSIDKEKNINQDSKALKIDVKERDSKKQPSGLLKLFDDSEEKIVKESIDNVPLDYNKLNALKKPELRNLCKEKGYKNYSKLVKEDLIKFIMSQ